METALSKSVKRDDAGNELRHPDGSGAQWLHYKLPKGTKHAGLTFFNQPGIAGLIELADGTVYDVTEHWFLVRDEHVEELRHAILDEFHRQGKHLGITHEGLDRARDEMVAAAKS